ncbi:hybrid sensor histidine kinase/response regulator [Aureimonas sp. AU4]|uniref:hybrid sensor histidine kinase/response regulator n=1 Tax=Aureimonas sp. AU4 TaxID=1638163 RepID=UPI00078546B0|nr:hybrid sensor histidine kinase/response regulator [Aureimonas sp. AU4]
MSLRIRLSLIFAGFAVALVSVLGLAAVISASTALRQAAERQLSQAAHQMSERLDLHMFERLGDITTAAGMKALFSGEDRDAQRALLERLQRAVPNYAWIGLAGPDGRVLVSTSGLLEGEDVSSRPWFAAGRQGAAALDVHEAKLLQRYLAPEKSEMLRFVDVTAPVYDEGRFIGVLAAHLSWDWVDEVRRAVLTTISDLDASELLVVSHDGKILLGPSSELGAAFNPDEQGFVTVTSPTAGMAQFKGLGWSVVARQPSTAAFMPVTTLTWAISLMGILLAAFAAFVGGKVASAIARPISRLADQAAAVRDGADISCIETGSRFIEVKALSDVLASAFRARDQKAEELLTVNTLLEERVLFRTRQLEEARRRAEQATEAKSNFLATVSHEIRSPLNSIIGFADLLLDEPSLAPDVARRIGLIHSAGSALTTVINDILDWSKIEAGKVDLNEDVFNPSCLLSTTLDLVEVQSSSKGLRLELSIAADVPSFVRGDMARLRQIVLNLLNNAVKFTPAGSVTLVASHSAHTGLVIEVRDTGIGISPEQLGRLFDRFHQADSSIERRFGGTGLGLAISRSLAELMGGTLTATSRLGQGSIFTLALPIQEAKKPLDGHHAVQILPSEQEAFSQLVRPHGSPSGRILLVEDLAVNREVATAMLEKAGYSVVQAESGYRAIELAARERFGLILMDIHMPGLDGLATTAELRRQMGDGLATPIIALTANVMSDRVAAFQKAGMNDYLSKPIQRSALIAKVEQWVTSPSATLVEGGPISSASFDRETFDEVVDLLGLARVQKSLGEITERLSVVGGMVDDRAALGREAHALVSLTGVLGLVDLAQACRDLEKACQEGADLDAALAAIGRTSSACLRAASELAASGGREPASERLTS